MIALSPGDVVLSLLDRRPTPGRAERIPRFRAGVVIDATHETWCECGACEDDVGLQLVRCLPAGSREYIHEPWDPHWWSAPILHGYWDGHPDGDESLIIYCEDVDERHASEA